MSKSEEIRNELGVHWIPAIYTERIRPRRTRSVTLPVAARVNSTEILFTLLGIELKIGRRRIPCPDLATARYLQVFARLGCEAVAVPYDITQISPLADDLEVAWQMLGLTIDHIEKDLPKRRRLRSTMVKHIREEIVNTGAGNAMPEFKRSTGQRQN